MVNSRKKTLLLVLLKTHGAQRMTQILVSFPIRALLVNIGANPGG